MRFYTNLSPLLSLFQRGTIKAGSDIAAVLKSAGVDGLELSARILHSNRHFAPGFSFSIDQVKGLPLSLHSNYVDFNPASANPYVRKAALAQLQDELELCESFSIPILTIHPGWARKIGRPQALQHFWNCLAGIFDSRSADRTVICLENMDHRQEKLCNDVEEIALTLERFPRLMLTVDFAHLGLTGIDVKSFLDRFEDRISHLHISGVSQGKPHGEVSLAESEIDFGPHLERFQHREIAVVIENHSWEMMLSSKRVLNVLRG